MPWTESRSREEWLAEVTRRGERMKRRRRRAVTAVAGVALLAPALAFASLAAGGDGERQLQVAAGGPTSTAAVAGDLPAILGGSEAIPTSTVVEAPYARPEIIAPAGPLAATTTTEVVHRRVGSVNGVEIPPTTTRAVDDPVMHPPAAAGGSAATGTAADAPSTTVPAPALAACPAVDVKVTVTPDSPTYAPQATVRWSSTLENRSSTTCLVSGRAFFRVEDATGKTVGSFTYTANYMLPVKAEPGKTITNSGSWDQRDCSGSACVQVPPGTYVVVAEWTEAGPYVGRGSFEVVG